MPVHGVYYVEDKAVSLRKEDVDLLEWYKWISDETGGE